MFQVEANMDRHCASSRLLQFGPYSDQSLITQIIDVMIETDLVDLVVRVMLMLKPAVEEASPEYGD
jgi:hypothetical protein